MSSSEYNSYLEKMFIARIQKIFNDQKRENIDKMSDWNSLVDYDRIRENQARMYEGHKRMMYNSSYGGTLNTIPNYGVPGKTEQDIKQEERNKELLLLI